MKTKAIIFIFLSLIFCCFACTDDFDEMNTKPGTFSVLSLDDAAGLWGKQSNTILGGDYQVNQEFHSDIYAQYFATTVTYFSCDRYVRNSGWDSSLWGKILLSNAPYAGRLLEMFDESTPEYALTMICYVYGMEMLCMYSGSIPYGAGISSDVTFVSEKDAYHSMIDDLTKAAGILASATSTSFASKDRIYSGDVKKWMKFANTMRMRIALRLVNKEPDYAKTQAELAYNAGVMETEDDDAWYLADKSIGGWTNYISSTACWQEFGMSSTIYSYLSGWKDPRLEVYFQKVPDTDKYQSVRNGMPTEDISETNKTQGIYVSNMGPNWVEYDPITKGWTPFKDFHRIILPTADAYFIRAEGALRGWNMGGTAKDLYEEGIRMSMKSWGVSDAKAEEYLNVTSDPAAPGDFYNSPPVCTGVSVKYNESDSYEMHLQQILTQRWLSLYTTTLEAWTEFRRTGYPILYPIIKSEDPELPQGTFIQRVCYPETLKNADNSNGVNTAIKLNGAEKDSQATKLYIAK